MATKPPHHSTELTVISNESDPSKRSAESGAERRRRPRLTLTEEQFRLGLNGKIFSVADLSVDGMALRIIDVQDLQVLPFAARVDGILKLKGEKYPVKAKVSRVSTQVVGFQFEDLGAETRAALERFLDPVALGSELKPIPASTGSGESGDGPTIWYHGPSGTDLLFWRSLDGQYRRFMLYVLGSFVHWDQERGLVTGTSRPSGAQSGEQWGIFRFETHLTQDDAKPDPGKLSVAKTLILGSNLPQDLKKWCSRQMDHS